MEKIIFHNNALVVLNIYKRVEKKAERKKPQVIKKIKEK